VARLFLLFTAVPLVDLWVLLYVGRSLGLWPTIGLIVATGFAGAWLAKAEGLRVLRDWQRALAEARLPDDGVLFGLLVLVGGVLLVTPGLLTDAVGLLLLFPPTRRVAAKALRRVAAREVSTRVRIVTLDGSRPAARHRVVDVTPPAEHGGDAPGGR
jgi:UPF0716 protein FxsA